ncbi:MAG: aldo/keto reductase [Wenzhouxiangellaceae bacterium]|nr:aldo/keto reductase [Wenzhouxiangellaceae bacterium]
MNSIPRVGFGLWKVAPDECADQVYAAIQAGYRHLDSACDYGNEAEAGQGIRRALDEGLCRREELWVTSKLWNTYHRPEHVRPALERTLSDLALDSLDLYMIHFPIALAYVPFEQRYPPEWIHDPAYPEQGMKLDDTPLHETWAAMEELVDAGLVKHLGVCNYNSALMHDLMRYARIKPLALQIELHPYLAQERMLRLCKQYGIDVVAYSPLGSLSYVELDMDGNMPSLIEHDVITAIAKRVGRTPAQVILRWNVQRGCAVLPKTSRPERLVENLALFDFELDEADMQAIGKLDRHHRFGDVGHFTEHAFNTFHPIFD